MPYSRVTRTRHGVDAIKYIKGVDGKGHNKHKKRNEFLTGINMVPDNVIPFEVQMQSHWDKADPRHTTQVDRFVVSYSKKEVDPDDPEQVAKAHFVGCQIARFLSKGLNPNSEKDRQLAKKIGCSTKQLAGKGTHQVMVATQKDGKGGCVHIHIAVNDVAMDNHKGLSSGLYLHSHLEKIVDYVSGIYFDLDVPEPAPEKETQSVRGLKAKNEKIEKANQEEILKAEKEGRKPELKELEYIWIDDLKGRILDAAEDAEDEEDFFRECRLRGVEVVKKKATKKQPNHYTFELIDVSGFPDPEKIPKNLKRKSYKLGSNYQPENLSLKFRRKEKEVSKSVSSGRIGQTIVTNTETPATPATMEIPAETIKDETKKVEKSSEEIKKEKEKQQMHEAEETAKGIVYSIIASDQDWEKNPIEVDAQGREWTDYDEIHRRHNITDLKWESFKKWRVEQRKSGVKLPGIYRKDKLGFIFVERDQVKKQFREFLHPVVKEEKTTPKEEKKTETKQEIKEKPEVKHSVPRKTEPERKTKKKTTRKAKEKRQWIDRNREILLREMSEKDNELFMP